MIQTDSTHLSLKVKDEEPGDRDRLADDLHHVLENVGAGFRVVGNHAALDASSKLVHSTESSVESLGSDLNVEAKSEMGKRERDQVSQRTKPRPKCCACEALESISGRKETNSVPEDIDATELSKLLGVIGGLVCERQKKKRQYHGLGGLPEHQAGTTTLTVERVVDLKNVPEVLDLLFRTG